MMHQKAGNPGFTTFTRARPRILPTTNETRKLEKETEEKMRKLAEIRSAAAAERQVAEELRKEVLSKGWLSLNPMPPSYEKSMKPVKSLLEQPPPNNFKIKRNSSTFKSSDAYLNENKFAKHGISSFGHLQNLNHGCGPDPGFDVEEETHCTSAMEALKELPNSKCVNPTDVQEDNAIPHQFQSKFVPISSWEKSDENHGTCRPMEIDTIPDEQVDCSWTTMNTQTAKPRVLVEVESKPPTTIEGTYFQHLFLHQDYHKKVQA